MLIRHFVIFTAIVSIAFGLKSCGAHGSYSSAKKVSWSDSDMTFDISSNSKSKKDVVDAVDVWGAKTFGSWQNVIQTKLPERGIIVFRYREVLCDKMVSVEVKPKNDETYIVDFSNVRGGECLVRESLVKDLKSQFRITTSQIEQAIAEF